uniref:EGF-like domain-containing protein n=1 Tax=Chromera velia CCMP2878 TaxID=1169474 RepID=A0A0G4H2Z1_9ALVE|eukprot:Cvel_24489.t1-p1 / transcript=Cvel_24489.t1 / gene=Cvel_24489 / organism=Chromera_velia_CCMP2878 / gene_product=Neurogenic locus Notch protein, putative / transcript_product=Neurogenic locus Notch protein, putative / location=Cvel_scaffold2654:5823-24981(+) / protein_length=1830 / sequence_SO=supercontig / SO=protein_coding / is_pseudo=false
MVHNWADSATSDNTNLNLYDWVPWPPPWEHDESPPKYTRESIQNLDYDIGGNWPDYYPPEGNFDLLMGMGEVGGIVWPRWTEEGHELPLQVAADTQVMWNAWVMEAWRLDRLDNDSSSNATALKYLRLDPVTSNAAFQNQYPSAPTTARALTFEIYANSFDLVTYYRYGTYRNFRGFEQKVFSLRTWTGGWTPEGPMAFFWVTRQDNTVRVYSGLSEKDAFAACGSSYPHSCTANATVTDASCFSTTFRDSTDYTRFRLTVWHDTLRIFCDGTLKLEYVLDTPLKEYIYPLHFSFHGLFLQSHVPLGYNRVADLFRSTDLYCAAGDETSCPCETSQAKSATHAYEGDTAWHGTGTPHKMKICKDMADHSAGTCKYLYLTDSGNCHPQHDFWGAPYYWTLAEAQAGDRCVVNDQCPQTCGTSCNHQYRMTDLYFGETSGITYIKQGHAPWGSGLGDCSQATYNNLPYGCFTSRPVTGLDAEKFCCGSRFPFWLSSDLDLREFYISKDYRDIDECSGNIHDCDGNATCSDNIGSFVCACNDGWTGSGVVCSNFDECTGNIHNCHTNATCLDNIGSFVCSCNDGWTGNGLSCSNFDECTGNFHNCHTNATCLDNIGSFVCSCNDGWTGDGLSCSNVDECGLSIHNCNDNATCSDNIGSFVCACNDGWTGDGLTCSNFDECTGNIHDCHTNATCLDNIGSFVCSCNDGWTGSGVSCANVDECGLSIHNCNDNTTCSDSIGSFVCACNDGWTGSGVVCSNVDECGLSIHNCNDNATCSDNLGSFVCACNDGWTGTGLACSNVDECSANSHNCHGNATCSDNIGRFLCTCNPGHSGSGVSCNNVNECTGNIDNCHTNATCSDNIGSFLCACNDGWTGTGVTCSNVNECSGNIHDCNDNATCSDNIGSFVCSCNDGWTGSGVVCSNFDECTGNVHDCHTNATCLDNIGSFVCSCNDGWTGSGVSCANVDECGLSIHDCNNNATCSDNIGSFVCACNDGWTGSGVVCSNFDECTGNIHDCHTNATCLDNIGSFVCSCNDGWTGSGVSCANIDECGLSIHNCNDNATCSDNLGSFACGCNDGWTGTGLACSNVDECTGNIDDCHTNATCSDNIGSFLCACNDGWTGTGVSCSNVNECSGNIHDCNDNATCSDNIGSFVCACNDGWTGSGVVCSNVDECTGNIDDCHTNATCSDNIGSFLCACNDGWTGTGVSCSNVDECASSLHNCDTNTSYAVGVCNETIGSFECGGCLLGFSAAGYGSVLGQAALGPSGEPGCAGRSGLLEGTLESIGPSEGFTDTDIQTALTVTPTGDVQLIRLNGSADGWASLDPADYTVLSFAAAFDFTAVPSNQTALRLNSTTQRLELWDERGLVWANPNSLYGFQNPIILSFSIQDRAAGPRAELRNDATDTILWASWQSDLAFTSDNSPFEALHQLTGSPSRFALTLLLYGELVLHDQLTDCILWGSHNGNRSAITVPPGGAAFALYLSATNGSLLVSAVGLRAPVFQTAGDSQILSPGETYSLVVRLNSDGKPSAAVKSSDEAKDPIWTSGTAGERLSSSGRTVLWQGHGILGAEGQLLIAFREGGALELLNFESGVVIKDGRDDGIFVVNASLWDPWGLLRLELNPLSGVLSILDGNDTTLWVSSLNGTAGTGPFSFAPEQTALGALLAVRGSSGELVWESGVGTTYGDFIVSFPGDQGLSAGTSLFSFDLYRAATLKEDGTLVIHPASSSPTQQSTSGGSSTFFFSTEGKGVWKADPVGAQSPLSLSIRTDGNLVVLSANGTEVWTALSDAAAAALGVTGSLAAPLSLRVTSRPKPPALEILDSNGTLIWSTTQLQGR